MKKLLNRLVSNHQNIGFSNAPLTLGLVIFSHSVLKLLDLFDSFSLVLGLFRRFWVLSLAGTFTGNILTTQLEHGFLMNWFGSQAGEGYEYALLIIDLASVTIINGSGKCSINHLISKKLQS